MMVVWALLGILSAGQFAAEVQAQGPKAAVQRLVDGGDWARVQRAISNGAPDWIALAPQLARGGDPALQEQVGQALAAALPRSPAAVLAVIDPRRAPGVGVQIVCGSAFAGDGARIAAARAAVEAVSPVAGGKAREVCLKELAAAG